MTQMTDLQLARIRWLAAKVAAQRAQSEYVLAMRQAEREVMHLEKLKRAASNTMFLRPQGE